MTQKAISMSARSSTHSSIVAHLTLGARRADFSPMMRHAARVTGVRSATTVTLADGVVYARFVSAHATEGTVGVDTIMLGEIVSEERVYFFLRLEVPPLTLRLHATDLNGRCSVAAYFAQYVLSHSLASTVRFTSQSP